MTKTKARKRINLVRIKFRRYEVVEKLFAKSLHPESSKETLVEEQITKFQKLLFRP